MIHDIHRIKLIITTKMAALLPKLDFSSAQNLEDVIVIIRTSELPNQEKGKILRLVSQLDRETYRRNIDLLKILGLTTHDEYRIFRYRGDRYRFENQAGRLNPQEYPLNANYLILDSLTLQQHQQPEYVTNDQGIVISFFYDGRNMIYLPDSEYFLRGKKIFITPTIYDGVQYITNHRVESDRIQTLLKYLDPDTNYVYIKETGIIYNINGDVLYAKDLRNLSYLQAIHVLDTFHQPYPKGFLVGPNGLEPGLLELINNPTLAFVTNVLVTDDFLDGTTKFYQDLGINNLCTNLNITLYIDPQKQLTDVIPADKRGGEKITSPQQVIQGILSCRQPILIQPIGLIIEGQEIQRHLIVMILDVVQGRGYLFDPSYTRGGEFFEEIYRGVIRYFRKALRRDFPTLEIRSLSDFGCPFGYALQERGDVYCRSWSLYLSILYLLNPDRTFEEIVTTLYNIGFPGIRAVIPRFLLGIYGDTLFPILNIQTGTPPATNVPTPTPEVVQEKPITIKECQDFISEWGWQSVPLVSGQPNYNQEPEEIGILTGEPSKIVVLTISPTGIDYWKQVIGDNDPPITFTVMSNDDEISYYFHNISIDDLPSFAIGDDIFFRSTGDFVVAPCFEQYEIVEGFADKPLLAIMPTWLSSFLRESLQQEETEKPNYQTLRIVDLKQLLRDRKLPVTGRKEDLIRRLEDDDRRRM